VKEKSLAWSSVLLMFVSFRSNDSLTFTPGMMDRSRMEGRIIDVGLFY
jgi:hypothetical protein